MESRRIILANEPRLLREMWKRVFDRVPDLQVVGEVTDLAGLSSMVEQVNAEWVVVSLLPDGRLPDAVEPLLTLHPSVSVLAMSIDGSQVRMRWVDFQEETLDGVTLDELIAVLRRQSA